MKFNLIQIAGIFAIIQALIISLYFIYKSKKAFSKELILALLFLTYSVLITCSLFLSSGINPKLFLPAHILNQFAFLVGPLVFLYVITWILPETKFQKKHLIHFIPFLAVTSYLSLKFYVINIPLTCRSNHVLIGSTAFIQTFIYFTLSYKLLIKHDFLSKNIISGIKQKTISWLPLFIYGCFLIWLTKFAFFIVWDLLNDYQSCNELINLHFLVLFLLFNILLFFLLIRPQLFSPVEKYKYSILSDMQKQELVKMLISYMDKEKAYRNSLLSLKGLAKQLAIGERYLSQIINESFNSNFYDFVNRYRIEESKKIIRTQNGTPQTLISIAYDVGFNSKSTFNSAFKKYTGYTPTEYRQHYMALSN